MPTTNMYNAIMGGYFREVGSPLSVVFYAWVVIHYLCAEQLNFALKPICCILWSSFDRASFRVPIEHLFEWKEQYVEGYCIILSCIICAVRFNFFIGSRRNNNSSKFMLIISLNYVAEVDCISTWAVQQELRSSSSYF